MHNSLPLFILIDEILEHCTFFYDFRGRLWYFFLLAFAALVLSMNFRWETPKFIDDTIRFMFLNNLMITWEPRTDGSYPE